MNDLFLCGQKTTALFFTVKKWPLFLSSQKKAAFLNSQKMTAFLCSQLVNRGFHSIYAFFKKKSLLYTKNERYVLDSQLVNQSIVIFVVYIEK